MAEVNWGLARRVANRVARVRASNKIADLPAGVSVEEVARRVSAYAGIESPADLPVREILVAVTGSSLPWRGSVSYWLRGSRRRSLV